jgi:hypothetical protein
VSDTEERMEQYISCLQTSVTREVLYNTVIEFCMPIKLVRLIKMYLNEAYNKVRIHNHLSDAFPIQNGLKQGEALPS